MNRFAKQLLYGLFYLLIAGLVGCGVYLLFLYQSPSCSDNILNQEEEQIDCGGPCINCELKNLRLQISEVEILAAGQNETTLLANLTNPSSNYGVLRLTYEFDINGVVGGRLDSVRGVTSVYPGETRRVIAAGLPFAPSEVYEAILNVEEPVEFRLAGELPLCNILLRQIKTNVSEEQVRVEGLVTNNSSQEIGTVRLIAFFFNGESQLSNATTTIVTNLLPFKSKDFVISPPNSEGAIDPQRTHV